MLRMLTYSMVWHGLLFGLMALLAILPNHSWKQKPKKLGVKVHMSSGLDLGSEGGPSAGGGGPVATPEPTPAPEPTPYPTPPGTPPSVKPIEDIKVTPAPTPERTATPRVVTPAATEKTKPKPTASPKPTATSTPAPIRTPTKTATATPAAKKTTPMPTPAHTVAATPAGPPATPRSTPLNNQTAADLARASQLNNVAPGAAGHGPPGAVEIEAGGGDSIGLPATYANAIRGAIKRNFIVTRFQRTNAKCKVSFTMLANGRLIDPITLEETSGFPFLDDIAVQAVKKTSMQQLPQIPDGLRRDQIRLMVTFDFALD